MPVVTQIQIRRGLAASWTSANPTLAAGEFGYETDTGKAKIGNGSSAWNSLSYSLTGSAGTVTSITAGTGLSGGTITASGTIAIDSTVATLTGSQTLTNKTLTSPIISSISNTGTLTLPATTGTVALTSDITVTASSANTFTNKGIDFATNTLTTTLAQLNTAVSDADVASLAGTETLTNKTLTDPKINLAINAQTGTTYTFVLTDNGKWVTASNASAITVTIPPISSVAYATGAQLNIVQKGAGQVTFAQGSGVTIRSTGATATAPKLRAQYSSATCIHEGSDVWYVVGDIS